MIINRNYNVRRPNVGPVYLFISSAWFHELVFLPSTKVVFFDTARAENNTQITVIYRVVELNSYQNDDITGN